MNLTLNIEVSADTQETVAQIGDLNERVAWFLKEQAALERWRAERQNAEDRALAASIVRDAQAALGLCADDDGLSEVLESSVLSIESRASSQALLRSTRHELDSPRAPY